MGRYQTNRELEREIGELADLPRTNLVERWQELYRCDPPKGLSARILISAVAYEMQARVHGKLSQQLRQSLKDNATALPENTDSAGYALTLGTRLVREWQGTVHVVDVMEEGFRWQGRVWPSLSVIAREITGSRWSGPRFFGLKTRQGRAA